MCSKQQEENSRAVRRYLIISSSSKRPQPRLHFFLPKSHLHYYTLYLFHQGLLCCLSIRLLKRSHINTVFIKSSSFVIRRLKNDFKQPSLDVMTTIS